MQRCRYPIAARARQLHECNRSPRTRALTRHVPVCRPRSWTRSTRRRTRSWAWCRSSTSRSCPSCPACSSWRRSRPSRRRSAVYRSGAPGWEQVLFAPCGFWMHTSAPWTVVVGLLQRKRCRVDPQLERTGPTRFSPWASTPRRMWFRHISSEGEGRGDPAIARRSQKVKRAVSRRTAVSLHPLFSVGHTAAALLMTSNVVRGWVPPNPKSWLLLEAATILPQYATSWTARMNVMLNRACAGSQHFWQATVDNGVRALSGKGLAAQSASKFSQYSTVYEVILWAGLWPHRQVVLTSAYLLSNSHAAVS